MPEENLQPRKMMSGQWFWLEKVIIRKYLPQIGASGFAVYSFLASCVDEKQTCYPSQGYIAASLNCSRSTVCRAILKLERVRLIRRSVGVSCRRNYHLAAISPDTGVDRKDSGCRDATDLSHQCNRDVAPVDTNNNQGRRLINNNWEKENLLAGFLADSLNNLDALPVYRSYARRYPEGLLRKVLSEAKDTPDNKIRKSRSHLFAYLLKKYV
jgi:hypothetical protein